MPRVVECTMKKMNIYIPYPLHDWIFEQSKKSGIPVAEYIRRMLEREKERLMGIKGK
ncbi:MAG: hypothetical protein WC309_01965 [Candidatus Paceibacterota bacterium]|jgi:hypothetical protein